MKDFNVLIDSKRFFNVPKKKKRETQEKIIEKGKNKDYTTGNLLNYDYFSKHCKLVGINLSKQIELEKPVLQHQINLLLNLKQKQSNNVFHD